MAWTVRHTTPNDQEALIEFLARSFSANRTAPFLDPAMLNWKYWDKRAGHPEPRSFIVERDGVIVAHAGLWTATAAGDRYLDMIDWAADPKSPGAGVSLFRHLAESYTFVYGIGGTPQARLVLPRIGFREVGNTLTWARPLRPVRQILKHQHRDWRLPGRLVRNLWWTASAGRTLDRAWTAELVRAGDSLSPAAAAGGRDWDFFQYLAQCPKVRCFTFHIRHQGRNRGLFALTIVRSQARLAGAWLDEPSPDTWRIAFGLAQQAAIHHSDAVELVARGMGETSAEGAALAGLRVRRRDPVFVYGPETGDQPLALQFQASDDDNAFFDEARDSFLT